MVQDLCLEAEAERMANRLAVQPQPAQPRPAQAKPVQAKWAPPVPAGRGAPRVPAARVPRQSVAIQPSCLSGVCSFLSRLFSRGSSSSSQSSYSQLSEIPVFGPDEGPKAMRDEIDEYYRSRPDEPQGEERWKGNTCSTSSQWVFEALGEFKYFCKNNIKGKGEGIESLRAFLRGLGHSEPRGVVIEMKLMSPSSSLHEFVLVQKGNQCYLIQSWLNKKPLEEGLKEATPRDISTLLREFEQIEEEIRKKDWNRLRISLKNIFRVEFAGDWQVGIFQLNNGAKWTWQARARRTPATASPSP